MASRTLAGNEATNMMRKGRVTRSSGRDAGRREKFVTTLFLIVIRDEPAGGLARRKVIFATPLSAIPSEVRATHE